MGASSLNDCVAPKATVFVLAICQFVLPKSTNVTRLLKYIRYSFDRNNQIFVQCELSTRTISRTFSM